MRLHEACRGGMQDPFERFLDDDGENDGVGVEGRQPYVYLLRDQGLAVDGILPVPHASETCIDGGGGKGLEDHCPRERKKKGEGHRDLIWGPQEPTKAHTPRPLA